jgi:hypothetical protein
MPTSDQPHIGVPPPEYRPTRDYDSGADSSMRNLALAAVGIAAVVMGGVWYMSGRHHEGVPVIEADPTPLRIKPANPGGMQVAGADDAMLGNSNGKEADALAPPPETPAPQALQQQTRAANAAALPPVVPTPLAPPAAAIPVPSAPLAPRFAAAPVTPLPAPRVAAAAAPPPPAPAAGGVQVQLAALDSDAAATAAWAQLTHRLPGVLDGHTPAIERHERDGKVYWRLRTAGFADIAEATQFCAKLRAKGVACAIASF